MTDKHSMYSLEASDTERSRFERHTLSLSFSVRIRSKISVNGQSDIKNYSLLSMALNN